MNGLTEAPITSCSACALCASSEVVTDTPIAAPMLRPRLNSAAPSVRRLGASVAKASTCSGVNTRPSPAPCTAMVMTSSCTDTSGVQPVITQNDQHCITRPIATSQRGSNRVTSRPHSMMVNRLPMPRGAISRPAVATG